MPDSFLVASFKQNVFGQELVGFGQPYLIECLSKDKWIRKFLSYYENLSDMWREVEIGGVTTP